MANVRGHSELAEAMAARGWNQPDVASRLGVTQPAVSGWLTTSVPKTHHRAALRILLGVPEESWLNDDERVAIERARTAREAADTEPPTAPVAHIDGGSGAPVVAEPARMVPRRAAGGAS